MRISDWIIWVNARRVRCVPKHLQVHEKSLKKHCVDPAASLCHFYAGLSLQTVLSTFLICPPDVMSCGEASLSMKYLGKALVLPPEPTKFWPVTKGPPPQQQDSGSEVSPGVRGRCPCRLIKPWKTRRKQEKRKKLVSPCQPDQAAPPDTLPRSISSPSQARGVDGWLLNLGICSSWQAQGD